MNSCSIRNRHYQFVSRKIFCLKELLFRLAGKFPFLANSLNRKSLGLLQTFGIHFKHHLVFGKNPHLKDLVSGHLRKVRPVFLGDNFIIRFTGQIRACREQGRPARFLHRHWRPPTCRIQMPTPGWNIRRSAMMPWGTRSDRQGRAVAWAPAGGGGVLPWLLFRLPEAAPDRTPADFILVHAISFKVPFTRVKVDDPTAELFTAVMEIVVAKPTGAAWTELAETAPAMAVVELTPRLVKNFRSFSSARFTRILAASSLAPSAAPTSAKFLFSKNRSTSAS